MITNSLNIKGLPTGNSREALCFQSQIMNNKNPKRERDLARKISIDSDIYKSFLD